MIYQGRAHRLVAIVALAAAGAGAPVVFPGCGTDAVGIDACRTIENAHCQAAVACRGVDDKGVDFHFPPKDKDVDDETYVENCRSLYNDACLHGLENTDEAPSEKAVNRCVEAIQATATCKKADVATMAECTDVVMVEGNGGLTPCQALAEIETLDACKFVKKPAEEDGDTTATTGSGGGGGGGGS